jgi:hypothetical protein
MTHISRRLSVALMGLVILASCASLLAPHSATLLPNSTFRMQLQGSLPEQVRADVFVLDLFDAPADTIARYQAQGAIVLCYFSAGSSEDWREDRAAFADAIIGKKMQGWDGEHWLDVSNIPALMQVMRPRLQLAKNKGCDGVDPDNMNVHTQDSGFALTPQHMLDYARTLAAEAHRLGLKIGLKNNIVQSADLVAHFDFAVNESCVKYNQCHHVLPFVAAGKPVYAVSYLEDDAPRVCGLLRKYGFSGGIGNRALNRPTQHCSSL